MLETVDVAPDALHMDERSDAAGRLMEEANPDQHRHRSELLERRAEESDLCDVDLGDVTVNDVWHQFSEPDCKLDDGSLSTSSIRHEASDPAEDDMFDLMGCDPRRMVARAPFLDTVEEESEEGFHRDDKNGTSAAGQDAGKEDSFQMVEASPRDGGGRGARLRRSLTLTKGKMSLDSKASMRKLVRLEHRDSPKREYRNRLAKGSPSKPFTSGLAPSSPARSTVNPVEKRLSHKPVKKRRKSRLKGVAVMVGRHQFTVVDEDDSLVQRFGAAQINTS
uniref:Uncharacterized protein n=1 Tax=Kalmanozyma brasiliensis (strain GHG001) TaxID=1365824 RepID=V5ECI6_KALBG